MKNHFIELLARLRDRTEAGSVLWEPTVEESEFRTILPSGMVRIGERDEYEWNDELDDHVRRKLYQAWLLTPEGWIVQELKRSYNEADYQLLESLYTMARCQARGSDDLIDRMLQELKLPHIPSTAQVHPPRLDIGQS